MGIRVKFTNQSQNAIGYVWDFGDMAGYSTDPNPTYEYGAEGTYSVTLAAFNVVETRDETIIDITVGSPTPPDPEPGITLPEAFILRGDIGIYGSINFDALNISGGPAWNYASTADLHALDPIKGIIPDPTHNGLLILRGNSIYRLTDVYSASPVLTLLYTIPYPFFVNLSGNISSHDNTILVTGQTLVLPDTTHYHPGVAYSDDGGSSWVVGAVANQDSRDGISYSSEGIVDSSGIAYFGRLINLGGTYLKWHIFTVNSGNLVTSGDTGIEGHIKGSFGRGSVIIGQDVSNNWKRFTGSGWASLTWPPDVTTMTLYGKMACSNANVWWRYVNYYGTNFKLYRSGDAGSTWDLVYTDTYGRKVVSIEAMDSAGDGCILVCGDGSDSGVMHVLVWIGTDLVDRTGTGLSYVSSSDNIYGGYN